MNEEEIASAIISGKLDLGTLFNHIGKMPYDLKEMAIISFGADETSARSVLFADELADALRRDCKENLPTK